MMWRPFNFVTFLSLLFILVLAGLCGWSYHRTDVVGYVNSVSGDSKCTEICLASTRGQLSLVTIIDAPPALKAPAGKFGWQVSDPVSARANFGLMGFSANRAWSSGSGALTVGAPYWFLIIFAAMVPAWWSHRRRRKAAKR